MARIFTHTLYFPSTRWTETGDGDYWIDFDLYQGRYKIPCGKRVFVTGISAPDSGDLHFREEGANGNIIGGRNPSDAEVYFELPMGRDGRYRMHQTPDVSTAAVDVYVRLEIHA